MRFVLSVTRYSKLLKVVRTIKNNIACLDIQKDQGKEEIHRKPQQYNLGNSEAKDKEGVADLLGCLAVLAYYFKKKCGFLHILVLGYISV